MLVNEETPAKYHNGLVVVIAASTGGPQALAEMLPRIPSNFPGTIIVLQQMRNGFTRVLADMLNQICNLPVHEPVDGQTMQPSRIYMTPSNCRLTVSQDNFDSSAWQLMLEDVEDSPELRHSRVDSTMSSIGEAFGKNAVGVLLTGTGSDGCEGMKSIHNAGGVTIAQDADSCALFDLPSSAIDTNMVHEVLPLWSIADRIIDIVRRDADAVAA